MSKILIIEDDIFLGDVLVQKFKSNGYEVNLARDGGSGLKQIYEWKPDLILLDILLPVMNGYEILEAKKKDTAISEIPVIVVSNSGQPVEINRALALGVKDYLVKAQFDPEEVLVKVRMQLNKDVSSPEKISDSVSKEKKEKSAIGTLRGKTIMWVEDDQFLSDIIARKLSVEGATLIHASDYEGAMKELKDKTPDLILLDILLSGIDGFEILRQLKDNPKRKAIPVILLSNLGQRSDIDKGKQLGAARFLLKATITLDQILDEIKTVLKKKNNK